MNCSPFGKLKPIEESDNMNLNRCKTKFVLRGKIRNKTKQTVLSLILAFDIRPCSIISFNASPSV
jgi:hypothetical protein